MSDEFPDKYRGKQGARAFFSIDEKIERHEKEKKEAEMTHTHSKMGQVFLF